VPRDVTQILSVISDSSCGSNVNLTDNAVCNGDLVVRIDGDLPISDTILAGGVIGRVLWDTGAQDCFMDKSFADAHYRKQIQTCDRPIKLEMFDGNTSSAGDVTEFVFISFCFPESGVSFRARFLLTGMSGYDVLLGDKWMKANEIVIDTGRRQVTMGRERIVGGEEQKMRSSFPNSIPVDPRVHPDRRGYFQSRGESAVRVVSEEPRGEMPVQFDEPLDREEYEAETKVGTH